jgi:acyl-CoA reductase-like NAD-dependent aldehyde dehydrogenase
MFDHQTPSYFLNPTHVEISHEGATPVIDPATLEQVGVVGEPTAQQLDEILNRVNAAQKKWAKIDSKTRAGILHKIAQAMEQADMTDIAVTMTREIGKPYPESIGEIANIPPVFRYFAEMARDDAGKIAGSMQADSFQFQTYAPYGVSVHVVPYNFPLILGCWTMAASLAAGNGIVLKASPAGTLCTMEFMRFFKDLPEDLIACVPGGPEVGKHLIASKKTHAVAFTGSAKVGKTVAADAAIRMKPFVIEGGGSDPLIVSSHANVQVAAAGTVTAAFLQSGQVCTSAERVFVDDKVYHEFLNAFIARTRQLRIGNGLGIAEIGPLVSEAARSKVLKWLERAKSKGATIALGGAIPESQPIGWYLEPTIVTDVTADMGILDEEIFGPVVAIVRTRSFQESIDLANDTDFGLGACVFTNDLAEAHQAIDELEAGMVWVNNPLVDNDALPFGGIKNSGMGRALGRNGLDAFRRPKMVVLDPVAKEADWWYPYPDEWFYSGGAGGGGRKHV